MGRIDTILEEAAKSNASLENALLQCVILARELDYEPLKVWASKELTGYKTVEELPDYRRTRSALKGRLRQGRFFEEGFIIPESWISETLREKATTVYEFNGVGHLLAVKDDGSMVMHHVSRDIIEESINREIQEHNGKFVWIENVSLAIPLGFYAGLFSSIRLRLVNFSLELKDLFPDQTRIESDAERKVDSVERLFSRAIIQVQNVERLSVAEYQEIYDESHHMNILVEKEDFESLRNFLSELGITYEQIEQFRPIAERLASGDDSEEVEKSLVDWVKNIPKNGLKAAGEGVRKSIAEGVFNGLVRFAPKMTGWLTGLDIPDVDIE